MISQTEQQIIPIHILPDVSRNKCKQTMTFGQLIEYDMRYIFLKMSYTKCSGKTSPRPFYKQSKLGISLKCEMLYSFFIECPRQGQPKYIKTKVLTFLKKLFKTAKRGLKILKLTLDL